MRIAKVNRFYKDKAGSERIAVTLIPKEHSDDLDMFEPQNTKQLKAFISELKYLMRKSLEYSQLMRFLKEEKGLGICGVHPNISHFDKFSIDIHHTPFVAEDIIYTVVMKRYMENESLKMSAIIEEVITLHYLDVIGLYPLCETCHAYVHGDENDLFIPLDNIYGEPTEFYNMYKKYMAEELRNKYETFLLLNQGYHIIENNLPPSLMKKYVYIEGEERGTGSNMISTSRLAAFINETSK